MQHFLPMTSYSFTTSHRTATLESFGSYYCVVKTTNAYGCALSEAARVSLSIGDPVQNAQVHDGMCYSSVHVCVLTIYPLSGKVLQD